MMGVVIVNPVRTAYPMTQAQYDALGQQELQADFTAGDNLVNSIHVKTQYNANGTKTYFSYMDVPEPQAYSFNLAALSAGGNVSGSALIAFSAPPSKTDVNVTYNVTARLQGLTPGQSYTAVLSEGKSHSGVAVPQSQFANVMVNVDGTGTVTGTVKAMDIPQGVWNLDILDGSKNVVATGLINQPSFAYERFLPNDLQIHDGDTVVWTETGSNEIHTVTFLPKGWSDIPSESLMPVPYGGHIYAGTGFFNSGFVTPGNSYAVTFIKTGDFQYRCLLHDTMGMIGTVNVLPNAQETTIALDNTVVNLPSKRVNQVTYMPIYYLQQLLKNSDVQSAWNGHDWKLSTGMNAQVHSLRGTTGKDRLYINGTLAGSIGGRVWLDRNTGRPTTYMAVTDLQNMLRDLGWDSTFDGSTWDLTPIAHAGSVPSVSSASSGPTSH